MTQNHDTKSIERSLHLLFMNHEDAHYKIRELLYGCESVLELSAILQEWYEGVIQYTLNHAPSGTGADIIRELCLYQPSSIFDALAKDFWTMYAEEAS